MPRKSSGCCNNSKPPTVSRAGLLMPVGETGSLESVERLLGFVPGCLKVFAAGGQQRQTLFDADFKARFAGRDSARLFLDSLDVPAVLRGSRSPQQVTVRLGEIGFAQLHPQSARRPEGIGIVVELGKDVTEVNAGDRVAVPVLGYACGSCEYCISGWETLCAKRLSVGYFVDGTFAEYVKANAKFVGSKRYNDQGILPRQPRGSCRDL